MKGNCYGDFQCPRPNQINDFNKKDNGQMGDFLSDLWDKGVTAAQTAATKYVTQTISNVVPTSSVPAQNIVAQPVVQQGTNTISTQYVNQPMTEFQKNALIYGGVAVSALVLLGLVKTIFSSK